MKKVDLKSVVWQEGSYFVAQCLDVDVASFGDTRKEALANLEEAVELYFQDEHFKPEARVQQPQIAPVVVQNI